MAESLPKMEDTDCTPTPSPRTVTSFFDLTEDDDSRLTEPNTEMMLPTVEPGPNHKKRKSTNNTQESGEAVKPLVDRISAIHELLQCPKCLNMVRAPVHVCVNGHITCAACATEPSTCSLMCGREITQENASVFNNFLKTLPFPCRYKMNGCNVIFESGNKNHEQFCRYRTMLCPVAVCLDNVPVCRTEEHYQKKHPSMTVLNVPQSTVLDHNFQINTHSSHVLPVVLDGNTFFILYDNIVSKRYLRFHTKALYVNKPDLEYLLTIKLENGDILQCKTLTMLVLKGGRIERFWYHGTREDFIFKVPHSFLPDLLDKDGKLKFSFVFFKRAISRSWQQQRRLSISFHSRFLDS